MLQNKFKICNPRVARKIALVVYNYPTPKHITYAKKVYNHPTPKHITYARKMTKLLVIVLFI